MEQFHRGCTSGMRLNAGMLRHQADRHQR
jgi:hypothetical protein